MSEWPEWIDTPKHCKDFIEHGFCVVPIDDILKLEKIRSLFVESLRHHVSSNEKPEKLEKFDFSKLNDETYLNRFHEFVDLPKLNDIRVKVHKETGASEIFKRLIFDLIKNYIFDLVGNEVVMQRQVNFVTHLPKDSTGLLYLHTDVWAGCSPYEVILWLPLVDVYDTKSMYITRKSKNNKHLVDLKHGETLNSSLELLEKIRPDIEFLSMKFGEALLFSPILMHGAEENKTNETRFILNVRFKSLFSPYGTKALGETFTPVNYRAATTIGLEYENEFGIMNDR